ncbi:MAG: DUF2141 domain-containing protein [Litorimonas sp.]
MNTKRFLALSAALAVALALPVGSLKASEAPSTQTVGGTAASQLVLDIVGLETREGQVLVGLYDTENGFETEVERLGRTEPVGGDAARIVFDGLPSGDYALKVFHDEDSDGELDTNFLGIPTEPYGFSNNASDPFSAPEWSETKFRLEGGRTTHVIDLN